MSDVEIEDFGTDELIAELQSRMLDDGDKLMLLETVFGINLQSGITLLNQMKLEFLLKNIDAITLEQLENLI